MAFIFPAVSQYMGTAGVVLTMILILLRADAYALTTNSEYAGADPVTFTRILAFSSADTIVL